MFTCRVRVIINNIYQDMKVFGVGIDLVKINRIQKILEQNYKFRFLVKVLHPNELKHFSTIID